MDPEASQSLNITGVPLDYIKVSKVVGVRLPSGVHHPGLESRVDVATRNLILGLSGYVLSDDAGPVVEDVVKWNEFAPPRWMPKWLVRWIMKRWTQQSTHRLSVTPLYIFPESHYPDQLGKPVKFYKRNSDGASK